MQRLHLITIRRIHLGASEWLAGYDDNSREHAQNYFCILCIELLPYIQANTRCTTKGLKVQDHGP
jgi:hypothetical protein